MGTKTLPTDLQRRLERLYELFPQVERAKVTASDDLLQQITEFCSRVEKSGSMVAQIRQEFIASCQRCATDIEDHIRTSKLNRGGNSPDSKSGGYNGRSSNQSTGVPLLPPPPPPKTGVANAQLIF